MTLCFAVMSCTNDDDTFDITNRKVVKAPAIVFTPLVSEHQTRGAIIDYDEDNDYDYMYYSLDDNPNETLGLIGVTTDSILTYTLGDILNTQSTDFLAMLCSWHSHDTIRAYFPSPNTNSFAGSGRSWAFMRYYTNQAQQYNNSLETDRVFWISNPLSFGYDGEEPTGLVMNPMDAVLMLQITINDNSAHNWDSIRIECPQNINLLVQDVWCFPHWNSETTLAYETMGNSLTLALNSNNFRTTSRSKTIIVYFALLAPILPQHQQSTYLYVTARDTNGNLFRATQSIGLPALEKGEVYYREAQCYPYTPE